MTRHAYRARPSWQGIGWWLAAALVAVVAAFAFDAVTGVLAGLLVLLIGVVLTSD
jgi:uncharacterized protein involved in cysteine biosynthesis